MNKKIWFSLIALGIFSVSINTNAQENNNTKKNGIVYFNAKWCGFCKVFNPEFEKIKNQNPNLDFLKMDVDDPAAKELAGKLRIRTVPTICAVYHKNGEPKSLCKNGSKETLQQMVDAIK